MSRYDEIFNDALDALYAERRYRVFADLERQGRDVAIHVPGGKLGLAAQDGIELVSGKGVSIAAHDLHVTAARGSVTMGRLAYLGERVHAGRSRNDQVAVDLRLFARDRLLEVGYFSSDKR